MRTGDTIKIFQDGKIGREKPATVLGRRAGGILVRFTPMLEDEEVTVWCRRRGRNGKYEAHGWNYWILPIYSAYSGNINALVQEHDALILLKY